ncbi:SRPBCC domain-containing protein [Leptolyngbya sp. AN02str]|uniref:SRPBCC domain-containing protein n=1 Tax=Leptolyngbya sp. AN02str TaxID=3423363 RepID=UPI003D3121E3
MPSLYTEIEINASRAEVWRSLVRKDHWLKWNTYLYDLTPNRPFRQGDRVLLSVKRDSSEAETEIESYITRLQPEATLSFTYHAPGFKSEHVFELQDLGRNRTQYLHHIYFSGALANVFLPFIRQDEQQGIRRMAWELKQFVERY